MNEQSDRSGGHTEAFLGSEESYRHMVDSVVDYAIIMIGCSQKDVRILLVLVDGVQRRIPWKVNANNLNKLNLSHK